MANLVGITDILELLLCSWFSIFRREEEKNEKLSGSSSFNSPHIQIYINTVHI